MLANYLIGLREGLEASLIVGILLAYLVRTGRRALVPRVWAGIALAIVLSLGLGALLTWGPYGLTFQAQEILGGVLSLIAVGFVTWMIFWMGGAASSLRTQLHERTEVAAHGFGWGVIILAFLSVGREGIETALFVWATMGPATGWEPAVGALLGILTAVLIARLVFAGIVRLDMGKFFAWTAYLLILVAAGVLAYGIGDLQEAQVLPGHGAAAYDISFLIPPTSPLGTVLGGLFVFTPAPTVLQVIVWWLYAAITSALYFRFHRARSAANTAPTTESPSTPGENE